MRLQFGLLLVRFWLRDCVAKLLQMQQEKTHIEGDTPEP